jgi:hypothetical protein
MPIRLSLVQRIEYPKLRKDYRSYGLFLGMGTIHIKQNLWEMEYGS